MNCSQIFCTFAVETTFLILVIVVLTLWIALKFFVLLQSKQLGSVKLGEIKGCELLSNFLYFCSRNNTSPLTFNMLQVVNCSQIFCTFAVETTLCVPLLYLVQVVNCSQIFCTFAVETTSEQQQYQRWLLWIALKFFVLLQSKQLKEVKPGSLKGCELLSNFLYFCSRNN